MTPPAPFVSIIIVNYNGKHYLADCLDALSQQTYPADCFEVIVSDNASSDGSLEFLHEHYPWVKLLKNTTNLGFSTGNNLAIRQSKADFFVLLNNDTRPSPTWLAEMVQAASSQAGVGIVTGHLQLFYDQLEVSLKVLTPTLDPDAGHSPLRIYEVDTGVQRGVVQYLQGFSGWESAGENGQYRWSQPECVLGVPMPFEAGPVVLALKVAAEQPLELVLSAGGQEFSRCAVEGLHPQVIQAEVPAYAHTLAVPVEQNTGSLIFSNGAGRDRGTYIRGTDVLFENSMGQYDQTEEVFCGCGASLLLKREMLEDTGLLDDRLFMYYEDTDLSWRARIRGWRVLYAAQARVRHIHCGTTREWSPFFLYLIERNRLVMVFKNGSIRQVLRVWGGYGLKITRLALRTLKRMFLRQPGWRMSASELRVQMKVILTLVLWQPRLWVERISIQTRRKVSVSEIESWFLRAE